jgi:hypothetical protein
MAGQSVQELKPLPHQQLEAGRLGRGCADLSQLVVCAVLQVVEYVLQVVECKLWSAAGENCWRGRTRITIFT